VSREIVDAIKVLEQEKGLDSETLMAALEDALLSAYKKQPGAARYARVDLDRETADFRVFELILPPELEEKLLAEVAEDQEPEIDPATGQRQQPRGNGGVRTSMSTGWEHRRTSSSRSDTADQLSTRAGANASRRRGIYRATKDVSAHADR